MNSLKKTFLPSALMTALVILLLWSGPAAASSRGQCALVDRAPVSPSCSSWHIVNSPNPGKTYNNLNGVAAVSASDVWAVGEYGNPGNAPQTLIEHWNGKKWSVVKSPSPGSFYSRLFGVAAISANNAWTVGDFTKDGRSSLTLIEHWNGSQWSIVKSPNRGSYDTLSGVAAISTSDVWAVGYSSISFTSPEQTLIEHWNGTTWNVVASPNEGTGSSLLFGVAVVSATDAWAVGYYLKIAANGYSVWETLIKHWDGRSWRIVSSPNRGRGLDYNSLYGVRAVSANDVWAVGGYNDVTLVGSLAFLTLIEHWDGTSWSVVPSPSPGKAGDQLLGVAVVSTKDVWAVGRYENGAGVGTLIEHWDGSGWRVVTHPNPQSRYSLLTGVAAVSSADIWAVGYYEKSNGPSPTLIEHYS